MTALDIDPEVERHERHLELLGRIRNGAWLDQQTFPPLAWAVPDVVPEGFGLLVGPPKLGKSWMALGLGLSVASGGRALGRISVGEPRPVLYLALEDGDRRLQDRCRKLLLGEPIPGKFDYLTKSTPADVLDTIEAWLTLHGGQNPLVMLDTLGKVMPPSYPGESAYSRDYRVGSGLKMLVDRHPGACLLVVHHTRKAMGEDWMDSTSGTQGLNGSADFTIALTRTRNESDAILKVTGRDVREAEYAMTATDGAWSMKGSPQEAAAAAREARTTAGLGDRSAAVVTFVNESPDGVKAADVAAALDMTAKDAGTYLLRLENEGRIRKLSRGVYAPKMAEVFQFPGTPSVGTVGSVGTDSRTSYTSHTSYTDMACEVCGQPMADLGDGATTHPGCAS